MIQLLLESLKDELNSELHPLVKKVWGDDILNQNVAQNKIPALPDGDYPITLRELSTNDITELILKNINNSANHTFSTLWAEYRKIYYFIHLLSLEFPYLKTFIEKSNDNTITLLNLFDKQYPLIKRDSSLNETKTSLYKFLKSVVDFCKYNSAKQEAKEILDKYNDTQNLHQHFSNQVMSLVNINKEKVTFRVTSKPNDIMYMSVSPFFDSCQNVYNLNAENYKFSHASKLLSNVFDNNSKIILIGYKKPFRDTCGKTHDFTPIVRVIVRQIENTIVIEKLYGFTDILLESVTNKIADLLTDDSLSVWEFTDDKYEVSYEEDKNDLTLLYSLPPPYLDNIKMDVGKYKSKGYGKFMEQIKEYLASYKIKGSKDDTTTISDENEYLGFGYKIDRTPFDEEMMRPISKIKSWIDVKVMEEDSMIIVLVNPKDTINLYTTDSKLIAYVKIVEHPRNPDNIWALLYLDKEYFKLK